jgi:serine/threonine protein kinase
MRNELSILCTLEHPGIVKYEGSMETEASYVILMEYCSYSSLQKLIDRRVRLTEPEVRYYVLQILDAVEYLHSRMVIHRDLKLENVFLQAGFKTKVGDFGISVRLQQYEERQS